MIITVKWLFYTVEGALIEQILIFHSGYQNRVNNKHLQLSDNNSEHMHALIFFLLSFLMKGNNDMACIN